MIGWMLVILTGAALPFITIGGICLNAAIVERKDFFLQYAFRSLVYAGERVKAATVIHDSALALLGLLAEMYLFTRLNSWWCLLFVLYYIVVMETWAFGLVVAIGLKSSYSKKRG